MNEQSGMAAVWLWLQDPAVVAAFQRRCGVEALTRSGTGLGRFHRVSGSDETGETRWKSKGNPRIDEEWCEKATSATDYDSGKKAGSNGPAAIGASPHVEMDEHGPADGKSEVDAEGSGAEGEDRHSVCGDCDSEAVCDEHLEEVVGGETSTTTTTTGGRTCGDAESGNDPSWKDDACGGILRQRGPHALSNGNVPTEGLAPCGGSDKNEVASCTTTTNRCSDESGETCDFDVSKEGGSCVGVCKTRRAPFCSARQGSAIPAEWKSVRNTGRKNSLAVVDDVMFVVHNKVFYYTFSTAAELGNEIFYTLFLPSLFWIVDPTLARIVALVWAWGMSVGQVAKDVVRWPRPASPPVVKLEAFYESEYGMPSTHAMAATLLPFSLFYCSLGRAEFPFVLGLCLACTWCLLVGLSRIYMGMHTVLDVIAGVALSALFLAIILPQTEALDAFQLQRPFVIAAINLALALVSFQLDDWSTSRGDTAQILALGTGIAVGSAYTHALGLAPAGLTDRLAIVQSPSRMLTLGALRFTFGLPFLVLTRIVLKAVSIPSACWLFGIPADNQREARKHARVELLYRYTTYCTVAFNAACTVPYLSSLLGL
uniref:sphingosine-1-phosphate phosphatase 1-like n=1 Tax=Myxine glutinosa TaxID=7769 RepID=UPI00358F72EE